MANPAVPRRRSKGQQLKSRKYQEEEGEEQQERRSKKAENKSANHFTMCVFVTEMFTKIHADKVDER